MTELHAVLTSNGAYERQFPGCLFKRVKGLRHGAQYIYIYICIVNILYYYTISQFPHYGTNKGLSDFISYLVEQVFFHDLNCCYCVMLTF